jgi:hypothetical protein
VISELIHPFLTSRHPKKVARPQMAPPERQDGAGSLRSSRRHMKPASWRPSPAPSHWQRRRCQPACREVAEGDGPFCPTGPCAAGPEEIGLRSLVVGSDEGTAGGNQRGRGVAARMNAMRSGSESWSMPSQSRPAAIALANSWWRRANAALRSLAAPSL